jgi:glycogen debranching enzyme
MSSTRTSNSSSSSARSQPTKKVNGNTVTFAKSSKESANEYGIDCGPDLLWKGWSVGGEYTKKLVIRNISTRTIEIKCRIPASVDFFMEFPEWFKLSPGVSQAINVTFRPTAEVRTIIVV